MAQWVRVLAVKPERPGFKSLIPMYELGMPVMSVLVIRDRWIPGAH